MLRWQPLVVFQNDGKPSRPGGPTSGGKGKAQGAQKRKTGVAPKPLGGVSAVTQGDLNARNPNVQMGFDIEAGVSFSMSNYFVGDEWAPQSWGPAQIADLQEAMVAAGLLSGDYNAGVWMDESANAFKKLLAQANRMGTGYEDALVALASSNTKNLRGSGGGGGRAPFQARLSNPDDLKEVFKQSAYNLLGGKGFVDEGQLDTMVKAYQEHEVRAQRAAYGGGTVVEQPSAQTFAKEQIEEIDPAGAEATRFAGYTSVLERLIGGG